MVHFNQFSQLEESYSGTLRFILCPHLKSSGHPDTQTHFIHLIDNPTDGTTTLSLCGVCYNVVKGSLLKEVVSDLTKEFQEKALKQLDDHLFWNRKL